MCFKRPSLDAQMLVTYKSTSVQEYCVLGKFQDATSAINYCNDTNYKIKKVFSAEKIMKSLLQDVTSTTVESDDINDKGKEVFKARKIMQNLPLELFLTKLFI